MTDKNGTALAGAEVQLTDRMTNQVMTAIADDNGRYIFPSVLPSDYALTGAKQGFRKASVVGVKVEVTKSYAIDITLEAGEAQQAVDITASARTELQAGDSTVGNALSNRLLPPIPALTRQINELIRYQPLITPDGAVAGARQDQNTFTLDGIDVTDNSFGGLNTFMRLPIENVDEFRVSAANSNAIFGRGSGGQISVISRRGAADFHGAAYWFHQNDNLNAATWTNKRSLGQDISDPALRHKIQEPELKNNRFGLSYGGPYPWWENTFFFLNYEGHRFPRSSSFQRLVPTETLKQGILRFRDAAGNIVSYDLASATLCGDGTGACDPRGLGLSPAISTLWANLPAGNDPSLGDGLNTIGYRGTVGSSLNSNYFNGRFDRNFGENWRFDAALRFYGEENVGANQISIIQGSNQSREKFPIIQNMGRVGVGGQLTDSLTADFAFGWTRSRFSANRFTPAESASLLSIPGSAVNSGNLPNVAFDLVGLDEPIDVGAQVGGVNVGPRIAGKESISNKNFQLNADFNWLKGPHTLQFGAHARYLPTRYVRDFKEGGGLSWYVAQMNAGSGASLQLPASLRPPLCDEVTTTNCLRPEDASRWDRLYAGALGLVDNINALGVRGFQFNPLPIGFPIVTDTRLFAPEFYFQDVWRARPSLTLTYGLSYGWQTAPKEKEGRMTVLVAGEDLTLQSAQDYLRARDEAARRGEIFNPAFSFQTLNDPRRNLFNTDWNNVSPRASAAWSPYFSGGFLGKLFGERKTVIRGGYSLIYDRQNLAQSVILPTQGVGFAQTISVTLPRCNATGAGGMNCDPEGANVGANGFRVGVDGTIPLPTIPELKSPYSPDPIDPNTGELLFPEAVVFQVDPRIEVAQNHAFDFTWQRELPGSMVFEAGYVGRYAKKLPQNISLSQAPYQFLDTASNQTFAQAFDALAAQLRSGVAAADVTPQGWFENQLRGTPLCGSAGNCTAGLAAAQSSSIINGDVSTVFMTIDKNRVAAGQNAFNNYLAKTLLLRSSLGRSNYNAGFATLRKRFGQGLDFAVNYTFSRSLDQLGALQSSTAAVANSFDLDVEYGPSPFDIRHQFNATGLWELPFGKGRRFSFSNGALDKIFGGWRSSWIFAWQSGEPLIVVQGPGVWGGSFDGTDVSGAIPTADPSSFDAGVNASGSGINLFDNPQLVYDSFRRILISSDGRSGRANPLRGLSRWNLDMSFGKKTAIMENKILTFAADFFNIFNHVNYANPILDLSNAANFGVITEQFTPPNRFAGSRWVQLGLRLEF